MHRSASLVIAPAVAVLALAGCAGGVEPSPSPTVSPTATSDPGPTPTPSPSAAPDGACAAAHLAVTQATGDAGAGSVTVTFAFENVGAEPCTLAGFPGVSAVGGGDGEQIGDPADRSDAAYDAVELPPGAAATASMRMVNVAGGGGPLGDACEPRDADGWRVYPPESTESIFVAVDGLTACAGDVDWITIDPIVG